MNLTITVFEDSHEKQKNCLYIIINSLLVIAAFFVLQRTYPKVHPLTQTDFKITKSEAIDKAQNFIDGEIPAGKMDVKVSFIIEKRYFQEQKVISQIKRMTGIQPYRYWNIGMISKEKKGLGFSLSSKEINAVEDVSGDWYKAQISPEGRILTLDFEKPRLRLYGDTLQNKKDLQNTASISLAVALEKAYNFMERVGEDTTALKITSAELKQDSLGRIFNLVFSKNVQDLTVKYEIKLTPSGKILYYQLETASPGSKPVTETPNTVKVIVAITAALVFFLLIVFLIIYLIQFSRQDTISFKISLPLVYFISLITILFSISELWNSPILITVLGTVSFTVVSGAGILLLYTISDVLARKEWDEKLKVLDRFRQGIFFTAPTGKTIFRGFSLGVFSLAIFSLILYWNQYILGEFLNIDEELDYSFNLIFPVLAFVLSLLSKSVFNEFFFRLFGISLLKRFVKTGGKILLAGIIFVPTFSTQIFPDNVYLKLLAYVFPTMLFILYFLRYDIITTIMGFFTFNLLARALVFANTNEPSINEMGISFYFIFLLLLSYALIAVIAKRQQKEEIPRYVPEYVEKQKEKERLMRELEIARTIQQQFLPADTPRVKGYDIAAFCRPAWEVGGDYFDYFEISAQKLGITIGDVSNKGISAAFFMTMVKGFLKALAIHYKRSAEILSETNILFYNNVERGHFISMIFGILNFKSGEFTFARAGHNPVLLLLGPSSRGQWLIPEGIAIGLTGDKKFRTIIREEKIQLNPGDVLVLYTDGYPEAMNEKNEEFGEENLQNFLGENRKLSCQQMIQSLEVKITKWEGKQTALDDRTIIVIKRLK